MNNHGEKMKRYGVMLIGCGHIGMTHLCDIYFRDNVKIIATVDSDIERAKDAAKKSGAASFGTDYRPFLDDPMIDVVIIATYTSSHLPILRDCLAKGKHVLCEKPIGTDLSNGKEFADEVRKAKTKVLVAHILRHNASYIKLHKMISDGVIGDLRMIRMTQNHHTVDHKRFRNLLTDCSPILDCGVHYIDVAQWFTGSKIVEVSGIGTKIDERSVNCDYTVMNFKTESGCVGYFEAGWNPGVSSLNVKDFIGTKGRLTLTLAENRPSDREEGDLISLYKTETGEYITINNPSEYKDMYAQFTTLTDMIENDTDGDPTIDEVESAFRVACAAEEAIATGRVIRL